MHAFRSSISRSLFVVSISLLPVLETSPCYEPDFRKSFKKLLLKMRRRAHIAMHARCRHKRRHRGTTVSNFRRLVLGCIDSYDSEQRRIFQHFSRSTRFAFFCTARISIFADVSQFLRKNFRILSDFCKILLDFCEISAKINKI